jgi:moderate conductance mechanosensitive channel
MFYSWWPSLLWIAVFFLMALLVQRLSRRIAERMVRLNQIVPAERRPRQERLNTLQGLYASAISFFAILLAFLLSLALFVESETLIWIIGLFSAAFGLSAQPLVSDFLSGVSFIFEDAFEVGEKVAIIGVAGTEVEGVIEAVNLRTTKIRAPTGELLTVPNGQIRVIRNYSRGRFSTADIQVKLAAGDLSRAITVLEELGKEAVHRLPNLLEPWRVISETGEIGQQTELTLLAKAKFGTAAELRPHLLALVQERLAEAEIKLAG